MLCISIGLTTASCVGCSKNRDAQKQEEKVIKAMEVDEAEPLEDLAIEAEVPTAWQVDLTWNKISRATGYDIVREGYSLSSANEIRRKGDRKVLARLSSSETSYQDTTVKKGCYYIYRVRAHCEYDELDKTEYDEADMPAILKSEEANVYTGVLSASWETAGYQNTAHDDPEACSDNITLPIRINQSNDIETGIEMTGVEIYRGTSLRNIRKWEDVPIVEKELEMILEEPALLYKDENVEAGETYYYQIRGYAEAGGERWHGKKSNYVKVSAVLPDGDYSMDLAERKEKEPSFEISLQSNIMGNARLEFIRNEWNGLVDYVYQKEDGSYHSASMYLESYRKGIREWTPYQGQELYLEGTESIGLRLAPLEGEKILWPGDGLKSAEIILRVNYNEYSTFLCFDLKEKKAFLRRVDSETDKLWSVSEVINESDINKKGKKKGDSVADVSWSGGYDGYYGHLWFYYVRKGKNCPDGVEIYRSEDNKNFSLLDTAEYPEYGGAKYEDYSVLPGKTYYYKARNYMDTDTGRIYGKFPKDLPPQALHANYHTGKYKVWLADDQENQQEKQFIIGIHSCSQGNPSLSFKYNDGTCETKDCTFNSADGLFSLEIKEYSTDGIHWKKRKGKSKGDVLPPKGTIYLKLALEEGQAGMEYYDKDNIARINVNGSVEKGYPQGEVKITYELESGKLSSISLTSDD